MAPEWQRIEITFRPQGTIAGEGRLDFGLRNVPGVVELADLSLTAGRRAGEAGGRRDGRAGDHPARARRERLARRARTSCASWPTPIDTTAHTLATFIRKELGLRSMLVDTQASYGGLEGLRRELAESDFIDMHAYWQHPDFAAGWSQLRFHIDNTTQVAAPDGGALASLAVYRVGGKPFTVSEYNIPAPNDYAGEALPMYASIAAAQDWDAIYAYTYLDFSARWDADHLLGFFDLAGNPSALSFLPVAALTFRKALLTPDTRVAQLALPAVSEKDPPLVGEGALAKLWTSAGLPPSLLSTRRLEIGAATKSTAPTKKPGTNEVGQSGRLERHRRQSDLHRRCAGAAGGRGEDRGHRLRPAATSTSPSAICLAATRPSRWWRWTAFRCRSRRRCCWWPSRGSRTAG